MKNEESRFAPNEESLLHEERKIKDEELAASNEIFSFFRKAGILHFSLKCAYAC